MFGGCYAVRTYSRATVRRLSPTLTKQLPEKKEIDVGNNRVQTIRRLTVMGWKFVLRLPLAVRWPAHR